MLRREGVFGMVDVGRKRWAWPSLNVLWGLLPFAALWAQAGVVPIIPNDYWWALCFGRRFALMGQISDYNLYLYTLDAQWPFVNQPWLSQWLMYLLVARGGHDASIYGHVTLLGVMFGGLVWLARRMGASWRFLGGAMTLAVLPMMPNVLVRTRMFAYPGFMLVLVGLYGLAQEGVCARRWAWAALLSGTILWVNVHGSFVLALALSGAFAVGALGEQLWQDRRLDKGLVARWSAVVAAVAAAACVNPKGPMVYAYVFKLVGDPGVKDGVVEWLPFRWDEPAGMVLYGFSALAIGLGVWLRRELRLGEVLGGLGLLFMACKAARFALWWPMFAALVLSVALSRRFGKASAVEPTPAPQGLVHIVLALGLCAGVWASMPGGVVTQVTAQLEDERWQRHQEPALRSLHQNTPVRMLARLAQDGYAGRLFHWQSIGGAVEYFLAVDGQREQVAFVDQRMEMIPEAVWDEYFTLSQLRAGWEQVIARWGIETMLLHKVEQAKLVEAMRAKGWALCEEDALFVLMMRESSRCVVKP